MISCPRDRTAWRAAATTLRIGSRAAAFTLVELILVVLILAALAGMAVPRLAQTYQRLTLEHHAFALAGLLEYAQATAVVERRAYRWAYDPAAAAYGLTFNADPAHPETFAPIPGRWGRSRTIPEPLRLSPSRAEIIFYPDGRAEPATLTLEGAQHERYLLTVDGATGHASAQHLRQP